MEWSRGQLDGELDGEGGAQLGLVGSAVLEQRQVWRVEEVQMEGIRCKIGGETCMWGRVQGKKNDTIVF